MATGAQSTANPVLLTGECTSFCCQDKDSQALSEGVEWQGQQDAADIASHTLTERLLEEIRCTTSAGQEYKETVSYLGTQESLVDLLLRMTNLCPSVRKRLS